MRNIEKLKLFSIILIGLLLLQVIIPSLDSYSYADDLELKGMEQGEIKFKKQDNQSINLFENGRDINEKVDTYKREVIKNSKVEVDETKIINIDGNNTNGYDITGGILKIKQEKVPVNTVNNKKEIEMKIKINNIKDLEISQLEIELPSGYNYDYIFGDSLEDRLNINLTDNTDNNIGSATGTLNKKEKKITINLSNEIKSYDSVTMYISLSGFSDETSEDTGSQPDDGHLDKTFRKTPNSEVVGGEIESKDNKVNLTWNIDINVSESKSRHKGKIIIEDILEGNQSYKQDTFSLKYSEKAYDEGYTKHGIEEIRTFDEDGDKVENFKFNNDNKGFILEMNLSGKYSYLLQYKTEVDKLDLIEDILKGEDSYKNNLKIKLKNIDKNSSIGENSTIGDSQGDKEDETIDLSGLYTFGKIMGSGILEKSGDNNKERKVIIKKVNDNRKDLKGASIKLGKLNLANLEECDTNSNIDELIDDTFPKSFLKLNNEDSYISKEGSYINIENLGKVKLILTEGIYIIEEVEAPEGYKKLDEFKIFEVNVTDQNQEEQKIEVENTKVNTQEPGTEKPGTEKPGTEKPGTEKPDTEKPDTEKPYVKDRDTKEKDRSKKEEVIKEEPEEVETIEIDHFELPLSKPEIEEELEFEDEIVIEEKDVPLSKPQILNNKEDIVVRKSDQKGPISILPKTGETRLVFKLIGSILILLGLLIRRKNKNNN